VVISRNDGLLGHEFLERRVRNINPLYGRDWTNISAIIAETLAPRVRPKWTSSCCMGTRPEAAHWSTPKTVGRRL